MDVCGRITLFKELSKEGKAYYKGSICRKNSDGSRINKSVDIHFAKGAVGEEALAGLKVDTCYTMEVLKGFISVDRYTNKDGVETTKLVIQVLACKLVKATEVKKPQEVKQDLPF